MLQSLGLLCLLVFTVGLARGEDKRPNILFLFADDLGRYASAYSDPDHPSPNDLIRTPVFDRIAGEGALFTNAFVSAPSCTPSRGAVYTGRHFFRNGSAAQLHHPWADVGVPDPVLQLVGMPLTLAKSGYHWGWSYKEHIPENIFGGQAHHYAKHGGKLNSYSQVVGAAEDPEAARREILDQVRGNFRDYLAARKDGQPFFYSFNPTNTHRTWVRGSGKKLWGLDPEALKGKLPPFLPDTHVIREDFADHLGEAMAFDTACGVLIEMVAEMGELDNTLVVISGDHGIPGYPRAKCNVYDFGARVLLAMRWPKAIPAGTEVNPPVSLIDLAPTFLAAADVEPIDHMNGQNLLPCLMPGPTSDSNSVLRGWALIGRERHVESGQKGFLPYPTRAIRTKDHLYVINFKPDRWPAGQPNKVTAESAPDFEVIANDTRAGFGDIDASPTKAWLVENRNDPDLREEIALAWAKRPAEELYDLGKDPHQMVNRAGDPEYDATRLQLRSQLLADLKANHDPRLDHDAFDRAPYLLPRRR